VAGYRLSKRALEDLDRLYEYGVETFGLEQANHYYDGLIVKFQDIADNPQHAAAMNHIYPELRRSVYKRHSVYFLPASGGVQIVRILGREDVALALR